jgi:hypothetical protein
MNSISSVLHSTKSYIPSFSKMSLTIKKSEEACLRNSCYFISGSSNSLKTCYLRLKIIKDLLVKSQSITLLRIWLEFF